MTEPSHTHRVFLGLVPDSASRQRLAMMARTLAGTAGEPRWVPSRNYHLTLRFFGHINLSRLTELKDALNPLFDSFETPLDSKVLDVRAFPSPPSRILACTMEGNHQLRCLAENARDASAGIAGEDRRAFKPHVTMARLKSPQRVCIAIADFTVRFNRLSLFQSHADCNGPRYEALAGTSV